MKQQPLFDWTPDGSRRTVRCRAPKQSAKPTGRPCPHCGTVFQPSRKSQKCCSRRCCAATGAKRDYWKNVDARRATARAERRRNRDKWRAYQREYQARHRERISAKEAERRRKNPIQYLDSRLRREYGVTVEEYNRMLTQQGGACAICGAREGGSKNHSPRLHVDHDHITGMARGLLCGACNRGIGQLGDDLERVLAAVRYLERFRKPKKESESA